MLNNEDEQMLQELAMTRNIKHSTMVRYRTIINYYVESQGMTLVVIPRSEATRHLRRETQ